MDIEDTTARITTWIAGFVALTVIIILPLGFYAVSYQYVVGSLETETDICADNISRLIDSNPGQWRYDWSRLHDLLSRRSFAAQKDSSSIIDVNNRIIAENHRLLKPPILMRSHELWQGGRAVARLEVRRTLYPLIVNTGFAAIVGLVLGLTVFVTLRVVPLRAVRRAEKSLRRSEHRYHTLFEESKDAIVIVSPEGDILDVNTAAVELFGYFSKEEMGSIEHVWELFSAAEVKSVMNGEGYLRDFEFSCRKKNGRKMIGLLTIVAVRDAQGETAFNIFYHDQTEQKRIERKLLFAQKMEAVGVLAGGVAHDFNSILTIIIGFAELMLKRMGRDEPLRQYVEGTLTAAKRAAHLVNGLLTFSRKEITNVQPVDLKRLIVETRDLMAMFVGDKIDFNVTVADGEMKVMADRELLNQVFMNLVANARDSMPHGGALTIGATQMTIDDEFIRNHGFGLPGLYVAIFVSDTGVGMDQEVKEKIFEPFFTTKEVGKGTGLGLSIVYGIIKQHHGYIVVQSEPGSGTVFTLYLPLLKAAPEAPGTGSPEAARGAPYPFVDDDGRSE